ncbi:hypothetical protein [Kushneria avicenniae]|nr:hypothetical protein [Kushneria avicenniae]
MDQADADTVQILKETLLLQCKGGTLMKLFKRNVASADAAQRGRADLASVSAQTSSELIDDSEFDRHEGFVQLKHRLQRAEWRQRQAYYEKYGAAPAPSIIRPGRDWLVH